MRSINAWARGKSLAAALAERPDIVLNSRAIKGDNPVSFNVTPAMSLIAISGNGLDDEKRFKENLPAAPDDEAEILKTQESCLFEQGTPERMRLCGSIFSCAK